MRVTNGMIRNNMMDSLYTNMSRLDRLYGQMSTLKKVQRPSDDPIVTGRALKLRINVLEATQYKSNTDEAISWMSVTEKGLDNMTEIIKSIRTKCVQASNDTLEASDREKLKADIDQLWEQLQQESNVTYIGRYVFSGYKTNEPVMLVKDTMLLESTKLETDITLLKGTTVKTETIEPDGTVTVETEVLTEDKVIPAGTTLAAGMVLPKGTINPNVVGKIADQSIQYEVGVGSTININTLGMDELMNELFSDIKKIRDGLNTYSDGTQGNEQDLHVLFEQSIGAFDERLSKISQMTADLGSRVVRLEYTASRLQDDKTNFTELLSKTEDVDLEEIYTEFNAQYAVYQSALQATSRVIMNTLADFLR